ncbi:MAG: ParA family protein [Solirubrobacteraceae bacterium]|nr:ParA family protein [Solirubrobacteraceae bacterium]
MFVVAIYSEKGGVAKSTTAIGLAGAAAARGMRVGVIDLDPRPTASAWLGAEPREPGLHVGAIIADAEPDGWAADIAVPCGWSAPSGIEVVPSSRQVALRERSADVDDMAEGRLRASLAGWDRDLVLIDVPNRQGGSLLTNALTAAQAVLVPLTLDEDGLQSAQLSIDNARKFAARSPWNPTLQIAGCVVTRVEVVEPKDAKRVRRELKELANDAKVPILGEIPKRVAVPESRASEDWWGNYGTYKSAQDMTAAYDRLLAALLARRPER